jgi:hypothetical protein
MLIENDYVGYTVTQKNTDGTKQHLKLNDTGLCNLLNQITKSVWTELPTNG